MRQSWPALIVISPTVITPHPVVLALSANRLPNKLVSNVA